MKSIISISLKGVAKVALFSFQDKIIQKIRQQLIESEPLFLLKQTSS